MLLEYSLKGNIEFFSFDNWKGGDYIMLSRRMLMASAIAWAVAPRKSVAAEPFRWTNPGRDPYIGTPEEALAVMLEESYITLEAHARLRKLVAERVYAVERIPSGFRFQFMLFGDGMPRKNVIAVTSEWPAVMSRSADVYRTEANGFTYTVFRPHVCNNWSCLAPAEQLDCLKVRPCPTCPDV